MKPFIGMGYGLNKLIFGITGTEEPKVLSLCNVLTSISIWTYAKPTSNTVQDLRKISLKPSFLRSLRSYAFGTLRERGSLFRDLCVSPT